MSSSRKPAARIILNRQWRRVDFFNSLYGNLKYLISDKTWSKMFFYAANANWVNKTSLVGHTKWSDHKPRIEEAIMTFGPLLRCSWEIIWVVFIVKSAVLCNRVCFFFPESREILWSSYSTLLAEGTVAVKVLWRNRVKNASEKLKSILPS